MASKENFLERKMNKTVSSVRAIAQHVTQSFEIESMTRKNCDELFTRLNRYGSGCARNKAVNDGNGWNRDTHLDGSLQSYISEHGGCYGTETSSSPLNSVGFSDMKRELKQITDIYRLAADGVYHTNRGSCHVHNTIAYEQDDYGYNMTVVGNPKEVAHNTYALIAKFFLKYMPVMKWLAMTDWVGARGIAGSSYDTLNNDALFDWYYNNKSDMYSESSLQELYYMQRDSYLRIYRLDVVHFENRMMDCTFSPTHLAVWMTLNKAMTLWAYEFAVKGYEFYITDEDIEISRAQMGKHRSSYVLVNKRHIKNSAKEMLSYLTKYLKILGSLDVIDYMNKLIETPVPAFLDILGIETGSSYDTAVIEKLFNTRNRQGDIELRERYLNAIKTMVVPHADNLPKFHENMAFFLGIDMTKAKSLYQMFSRENVEIEFLGGRLVYMGE